MRRLTGIVLAVALLGATSANASTEIYREDGTFAMAAPCAIVCSYWIDNGFAPCTNDFPPGSYSEILTAPAPAHAGRFLVGQLEAFSEVDWDVFVCSHPDREVLSENAIRSDSCDEVTVPNSPPLLIGCQEVARWVATSGDRYVLLAYNWSDPAELPYRLTYHSIP